MSRSSKKVAAPDKKEVDEKLVGLYLRITQDMRERVEVGRLADHRDHPLQAPSVREFLTGVLDKVLPPLPRRKKEAS